MPMFIVTVYAHTVDAVSSGQQMIIHHPLYRPLHFCVNQSKLGVYVGAASCCSFFDERSIRSLSARSVLASCNLLKSSIRSQAVVPFDVVIVHPLIV